MASSVYKMQIKFFKDTKVLKVIKKQEKTSWGQSKQLNAKQKIQLKTDACNACRQMLLVWFTHVKK